MEHAYFLVMPGAHLLDLAGPLQTVATLTELGIATVDTHCIGPRNEIRSFQQALLAEISPLPERLPDRAVLFVIGSKLDDTLLASPAWRDAAAWLRAQAAALRDAGAAGRICGVCTGAFLLGAAGLLDGRLCTTHYRFVERLSRAYPNAKVVKDRIYVRDRGIWTSAGVTTGIDMALHLVAERFGDDAAVRVARENVAYFRRFRDDAQLGVPLRYRSHTNEVVHAVQDRITARLSSPPSCKELAAVTGYSVRHLARLFVDETGMTIKRYQLAMRMDLAHRLLRESGLSIEQIARRCGFASVQAFRANWDKCETQPPSALRASDEAAPGAPIRIAPPAPTASTCRTAAYKAGRVR